MEVPYLEEVPFQYDGVQQVGDPCDNFEEDSDLVALKVVRLRIPFCVVNAF